MNHETSQTYFEPEGNQEQQYYKALGDLKMALNSIIDTSIEIRQTLAETQQRIISYLQ